MLRKIWSHGFLHPPAARWQKEEKNANFDLKPKTYLVIDLGAKASLDASKRESSELPSTNFIV
jgi:hypothetical protein